MHPDPPPYRGQIRVQRVGAGCPQVATTQRLSTDLSAPRFEAPSPGTITFVRKRRIERDTRRVPVIARGQGGVFTADQARAEDWSARQVRRRVEAGHWLPVAGRGLAAAVPGGPPRWSPYQRGMAAWLTIPRGVVGHLTAGAIHGFPIPDDGRAHVITVARHSRARGVTLHQQRLADRDVEENRGGLPLTTRSRTAIDLLGALPPGDALDLWAWLSTRRVMEVADLQAAVGERRHWRGTPGLRNLLDQVGDGAVSVAERRLHDLLHGAGISGWEPGVALADSAGVIGVVDVFFEAARLVVEIDGFRAHSSHQRFVDDRRRQNRLIACGVRVLRFTWDDLDRRPGAVAAQIAECARIRPRSEGASGCNR
jgi:uncharacterized protein DUF559